VRRSEAEAWKETANKLARYFLWEYEDYEVLEMPDGAS
jgi:hypothetical protein